jgi:tetratricopeptide (TPR) repeat protein
MKSKSNHKQSQPNISTTSTAADVQTRTNYTQWAILALIVVSTYIVYFPAVNHSFVNWDDQVYVENNDLVLNKKYSELWTTPISLNYHPITMISLAVQAPKVKSSLKAGPFIHFNIIVHLLSTIILFLLVQSMTQGRWGISAFVATIFALHPMHVESVAWVSERKDVLYTFFFLAAAYTYWHYKSQKKVSFLILTLLLFLLSVLSKAMAVVFPIVMLLMDYWAGDNMKSYKTYFRHSLFFIVSIFFGLMAVDVQSGGDFHGLLTLPIDKSKAAVAAFSTFSIGKRMVIASCGYVEYIRHFFWPWKISAFYPYPLDYKFSVISSIVYPLLSIIVLVGMAWSYSRSRGIFWGLAFYSITVALVLQFLSVGLALMADRYTYLPFIGLSFALAYTFDNWLNNKGINLKYGFYSVGVVFVLMLAFKTSSQINVWKDSENLWTQVLQYHPKEDLALANRGNHRGKTGNIQGAIQDFELAIADGCNRQDVFEGLGNGYGTLSTQNPSQKQELEVKAKAMFTKALELDPTNANVYYNLGVSQVQSDPKSAMTSLLKALELAPQKDKEVLPLITMCQINSAQYDAALITANKCLALGLNSAEMFYFRGLAYMGLGKFSLAKEDLRQAISIDPNHADAPNKLKQIEGINN